MKNKNINKFSNSAINNNVTTRNNNLFFNDASDNNSATNDSRDIFLQIIWSQDTLTQDLLPLQMT